MSDYCYSHIWCNERHVAPFRALGYIIENSKTGSCAIEIEDDQANYGHYTELIKLGTTGIPFYGYHTKGGEYGASCFCADGRSVFWAEANHSGNLVVAFDEEICQPSKPDIDNAIAYVECLKIAKKYVNNDLDVLAAIGDHIPKDHDKIK